MSINRIFPARDRDATTWEDHPRRDEYQAANDGLGMCNTGSGVRCICVLGGIDCNADHIAIARQNLTQQG